MKKLVPLLFVCCGLNYISAQTFKNFSTQLVIGAKLHTDNFEGPDIDEAWQLKSSPILGFELAYRKWPRFSFTYLHDFTYFLVNEKKTLPQNSDNIFTNLFSSTRGNFLGIYYTRKRLKYGLGHYNNLHESIINYLLPYTPFLKRHIAGSICLHSGRAEFEFVKLFQYKRVPTLFSIDNQYFTLKYKIFGKKEWVPSFARKENKKTALSIKLGMRSFRVRNTPVIGERKDRFGVSYLAGIEWKLNRINTSFFAERDWWLRLNAGSPFRDVQGYVTNSVVGIKYHFSKLRGTFLYFGYDWTTDYNTIYETWAKIDAGVEKVDLFYYNVKGLMGGIGFPVTEGFDVEYRGIFPLRGEKGFNPMRHSLGIIYKVRT